MRGGLIVSALDSGSGGPGSSPDRGTALCSWKDTFYFHSASLQPATGEFTAGGSPAMDWHTIQGGSRNTPSCSMLRKLG